MSGGISASSSSPSPPSGIIPSSNARIPTLHGGNRPSTAALPRAPRDPRRPLRSSSTTHTTIYGAIAVKLFSRNSFVCNSNSSSSPGSPPPSDENDSKRVLDAFFLGKALAEALNERIESAVGEFLSTVGRLQAEQQKQVLDFQDEVLERAKQAKEKAAREALEEQGVISKSSSANITTFNNGVSTTNKDGNSRDTDPLVGISIDD